MTDDVLTDGVQDIPPEKGRPEADQGKKAKKSISRVGIASVAIALLSALTTFIVFAGYSPIIPTK